MKNTATLGQIQKLLTLLEGIPSEQVQELLESGFLSEVLKSGDLDSAKQKMQATIEKMNVDKFWEKCFLIEKIVAPQDLIVTRPQVPYTYGGENSPGFGKYQMKFWKGKMGHPKIGGHISPNDDSNPNFLFEFYSTKPQPDHLPYPMEVRDVSCLYNYRTEDLWGKNWGWYKETVEHTRSDSRAMLVDIFRLRQHVQS